MRALFIPADPSLGVEVIEVNGRDDIREHLGGLPEATRYDPDTVMYVDDTGRIDGKPMNARATEYIRTESQAARQGRMVDAPPDYGLYGDVVVAGSDRYGDPKDVPDRLVERFTGRHHENAALNRLREAIGESRERNEDGMIRIRWRRDPDKPTTKPERSVDDLWNAVVQDISLAEGGFPAPDANTNLMELARAVGHPRWAITAAIHEAIGATEREVAKLDDPDDRVYFPENEELERSTAEKHAAIGVVREDLDRQQDQDLGFER